MHLEDNDNASVPSLELAVKSISTALPYCSSRSVIPIGQVSLVRDFLQGARNNATQSKRRKALPEYVDPARFLSQVWLFGPNYNLGLGELRQKLACLLYADLGLRNVDLRGIYRLFNDAGANASIDLDRPIPRIRTYFPKEVKLGSSRSNSTNFVWSKWMNVHRTKPKELCTVSTLEEYLQRCEGVKFLDEELPLLGIRAVPLIHGSKIDESGAFLPPSTDFLSNLCKDILDEADMTTTHTQNMRGASISKIVQIAPSLKEEALELGRWTTPLTFHNSYQRPVKLLTKEAVPAQIVQTKNLQQIVRHGLTLRPPRKVSLQDFVLHHRQWVGKIIGEWKVAAFDAGLFHLKRKRQEKFLTHYQFMMEISRLRR